MLLPPKLAPEIDPDGWLAEPGLGPLGPPPGLGLQDVFREEDHLSHFSAGQGGSGW